MLLGGEISKPDLACMHGDPPDDCNSNCGFASVETTFRSLRTFTLQEVTAFLAQVGHVRTKGISAHAI